ncbi:hypothetical protein V6Z11_A10G191700 [Gossypium hirsutum]
MDIKNGYFLAKFQSTVDYNKVLSQGFHLYQKQILLEIEGMVGKVTKVDLNTDSKARGRYALMAVYVNLGRPLISKILINGNPQRIEHENLCMVCFKCGRYGHIKENYSSNTNPPELKRDGELMEQTFSPSVAAGVEEYGPWMLVERRSRHSTLDRSKKGNFLKGENISGSRFNSLAYMEANFSGEDFPKENQRDLKKKGKVSSLDSQERSVTDNKADICGSKKGTVGQNSGKISNVQFNGPQNNKLVKDVNQAGSKSGWASYTPLAVNQRVHLDKQQTSILNLQVICDSDHAKKIAELIASELVGKSVDEDSRKTGERVELDSIGVSNYLQFILTRISSNLHPYPIFVAFVYGSPDKQKRRILWNALSHTVPRKYIPWMAIGDFNAILSSDDKKGGHAKGRRCRFFGNFMDSTLLHDLGFQIPSFTWHRGFPSERLDRAVGNDAWVEAFPNCLITHLPRIKLDHRPLLMKFCYTDTCVPNRPFRFLAGWLHHQNFPEFVKHNWRFNGNLVSTMEELTNKLQEWNKGVYGHITHRKRKLLHKLARIQHALDFSGSNSLSQQEALVRDELEDILHHEEILWKQKSRCEWLNFGDRNTSYFYRRTIMRKKFNKITALRNAEGD